MDPVWMLAVSLISPYVTKAGEKIAEKVGETLFEAIQKRFTEKKDAEGKKALANFKRNPQVYSGALAKILEINAQDKEFLSWLTEQVAVAQKNSGASNLAETTSVHQEVKGRAVVHGQVIGVVQGNVEIGNKKPKGLRV
jgi:hypothetical protein